MDKMIEKVLCILGSMLCGVALYILTQQVGLLRPIAWGDVYVDSVAAQSGGWFGALDSSKGKKSQNNN